MAENEIKVKITTDATDAVAGIQKFQSEMSRTHATSDSLASKLKENWVATSAAIAGAMIVVNRAIAYMDEGARALQQRSSFKIIAEEAGANSAKMIANMKAYTKETIDDSDLMQKATKLMLAEYNPEQIERFSKVAITASQYMGESVSASFERISDSLASRMPKAMVQAGAITREQMKIVTAAIAAGADQAALMELAIANLELKQKKLQGTQDESTLAMQRFHAQVKDTKEIVGEGLLIVMQKLWAVFQYIGVASLAVSGGIYKIAQGYAWLRSFQPGESGKRWEEVAKGFKADAESDFSAMSKLARQANDNMLGTAETSKRAAKSEIQDAQDKVKAQMAALKAIADAAKGAKEILKTVLDENKKIYEMEIEAADHAAKMRILGGENELNFALETITKKQEALNKWYEADAAAIQKSVIDEVVKTAKLSALYADYNKQWQKYADQREETEIKVLNGIYDHYADFYSKITGYEDEYRKNKFAWIDREEKRLALFYQDDLAAATWAAQEKGKIDQELFEKKTKFIAQGFGDLQNSFAAISKLYAAGSEDAKRWQEAAHAMEIAQRAVAVVNAVAAIANQGLGDPYTAFARIAAVAATMGALLASIGESIGGGGGASAAAPVRQASTVLGAEAGVGSESVQNAYKMLEDTYNLEDIKLTKIYNELKALNNNITGLVTSIIRGGGLSAEGMNLPALGYDAGGAQNLWTNFTKWTASGFMQGTPFGENMAKFAKLDIVGTWINEQIGNLIGSIFGGGTETSLVGSGIEIGDTLIRNILAGMQASARQYADILTKTEGGWFSSDSYSLSTIYKNLDSNVVDMFTLVFKNIGNTLMFLAQNLGTDTNAVLNYVFKTTKINLQGKTTDEMNKALQEWISNISDTAVEDLFGTMLKGYQKLNEGLMETAVRLISDKEIIFNYLKMTNQAFAGGIPEAIKFSETLITIAGSLDKLTDALQTYYEAFFSDAEKQAKLKDQLTEMLKMYGFDLPGSRAGYRALVESLNLTTEAGQAAYVALMQMSKGADEYYKYLENARSNLRPENFATELEYRRALAMPHFAEGGYASGWGVAGEAGGELVNFGSGSRVYNHKESKSLLNTDELVAEVKQLREEMNRGNIAVAAYTQKTATLLDRWEAAGIPDFGRTS